MLQTFLTRLPRAGGRAVDLGGPSVCQGGGQSLKISTKAAAFKKASLLIGGAKYVDWGARPTLGAGPEITSAGS